MNSINKIFILQWIGPFGDLEELKAWELNNCNIKSNFYILSGKEPKKRTFSLYVGITEQESVYKRLNHNHNKFDKITREPNIWIGHYSCPEHITHENIAIAETLLISYCQPELNEKKKKYFPSECVCIINQWFKPNHNQLANRIYAAQKIPDVILYDSVGNKAWGVDRMKRFL